jgi:glycosyltransferase involved in cell wall biosynthesis
MKILMSAYSCEPGQGSERGVGWNVVREIANYHEVWVLTRPDESKEAIEAELARNPVPNLHFIYFTLPIWSDGWRWGASGAMQIHYYLWQIQAYFVARRLHQEIGFDLVQHVTFGNYWTPSFLALLPVPFIWGPVGGGEPAPQSFWSDFGLKAKIYEFVRGLACGVGEINPLVRMTAAKSAIALVTCRETEARLRRLGAKSIETVYGQTGLNQEELTQLGNLPTEPSNVPIRFVSIGRLLHWKGFHLGLEAFAAAKLENSEYWVIGTGAEAEKLEALTQKLGISDRVKFLGKLSREETLQALGNCHVLVHPSLHDFSPTVCLEAMAAGRPVICLDLGGPGVQITEETGIRVLAEQRDRAISDISQAMLRLATDKKLRIAMGTAGKTLVSRFYSWQAKGKHLTKIYQDITNNHQNEISPGDISLVQD